MNGHADSRANDAAQILRVGGDRVERNGGAEIHDDARPAVSMKRSHTVNDPVGSDLARIVVQDLQAGVRLVGHEHRLAIEILPRHGGQRGIERRNNARDDYAVDFREMQVAEREQIAEKNAPLIRGLIVHRAQPPIAT